MTQKIIESDKSISDLLQTIEPKGIADESMRHTVEVLLNLIEQLQLKVKGLESENQPGVESALSGELKLPRELRQELNLNEKELEVLRLLCHESLTDQAIRLRLHISLRAVQNHIQHLKVKLGVDEIEQEDINTRVALCMTALGQKLLLL